MQSRRRFRLIPYRAHEPAALAGGRPAGNSDGRGISKRRILFNILVRPHGIAQPGWGRCKLRQGGADQARLCPAYNNLGVALKDLGRLQEAVASLSKAVQLKPDFAEAHSSLGTALHRQGLLDEAIASYDKALQIKPDLAEAYNNRGAALKDRGRLDEAIASFGNALRVKPDYSEAHNNLGLALLARGNLKEAIASFGKAVSISPLCRGAQ